MTKELTQFSKDQELILPKRMTYPNEFLLFCKWCALPSQSRKPRTQVALARSLGIASGTLSEWKELPEFNLNLRAEVKRLLGNDVPDLMHAIKTKAIRGDVRATELILKWLGDLVDNQQTYVDKQVVFQWKTEDNALPKAIDVDSELL